MSYIVIYIPDGKNDYVSIEDREFVISYIKPVLNNKKTKRSREANLSGTVLEKENEDLMFTTLRST